MTHGTVSACQNAFALRWPARWAKKQVFEDQELMIRSSIVHQISQDIAKLALGLRLGTFVALIAFSVTASHAQRPTQFPRGPQTVAPVAEGLIQAVVNISTSQIAKGPSGVPLPSVPEGSPFEEFFDDFFSGRGGRGIKRKVASLGSGFVIDGKEGLIVTNNHVIADADEIVVKFHDGSSLKVEKIIGRDSKTDLALLKVKPKKPLVDVRFGPSSEMRVGDWVMAIGNPFGLGGSVTVGIISAKQRDINSGPYDEYLQTDAAINKGNSGGPLFNMDGKVIGVNTAIISPTGGSIGIGFAVPSDSVVRVIDQLKNFGEIRRGWLGVKIQTVPEQIAKSLNAEPDKGAYVSNVSPKSPAAAAGIKAGDVIVQFDGKPVNAMRDLPRLVANTSVGRTVSVEIIRDKKTMNVSVKIGRLVEDEPIPRSSLGQPPIGPAGELSLLGLSLANMSDELRKKYGVSSDAAGVVVTSVDPLGPAARKNIKVGDIIIEVGEMIVKSTKEILSAVDKAHEARAKAVLLRIENAAGTDVRFVAIPIDE